MNENNKKPNTEKDKNQNMTALVSCFSRAYHSKYKGTKIFDDFFAEKILSDQEYAAISKNMSEGVSFFNPGFEGTAEEGLRWIVDNRLSPSVLGRSAFCENALETQCAIWRSNLSPFEGGDLKDSLITGQYVIFAAGYDTFACRRPSFASDLKIFELDLPHMIEDKRNRLASFSQSSAIFVPCDLSDGNWSEQLIRSGYNPEIPSFSSLLGISYYLSREDFEELIKNISENVCGGSTIVFDYPAPEGDISTIQNQQLASSAGEAMKAKYSQSQMGKILDKHDFLIYEHLDHQQMEERFFSKYNIENPYHIIKPPAGVNYILAVKKHEII